MCIKKLLRTIAVASILSITSFSANSANILFANVADYSNYIADGNSLASKLSDAGHTVTVRFLNQAIYTDYSSFDQIFVYDLSSYSDMSNTQIQNYSAIADWYNNRVSKTLILDGRIISSYSRWTNANGMSAEDSWIQNYATQLDLRGGGLVLGTDHDVFQSGINEINKQINVGVFSGFFGAYPTSQAVVDTASPLYIAGLDNCRADTTTFCINDNSTTGFVATGVQDNGQTLTPAAYHGSNLDAWDFTAVSTTMGSATFGTGNPVAVAQATPSPAVAGQVITLDGVESFHEDPDAQIISWEWDFDNDGVYDAAGAQATTSFPAIGEYPVILRVTDDSDPVKQNTIVVNVQVSVPPLAPTANAGGPYAFCPGVPFYLDGTKSHNPDDGQSETGQPADVIQSYAWDIDGSGNFSTIGSQPNVTNVFSSVGDYQVRLRVTDSTSTAYPSSNMGDLSDTDTAQVTVRDSSDAACTCITDLAARAKSGKVQLTWTDSGVNHYNVYRGTSSGGPYQFIANTTSRYSTYLDKTVVNDTPYFFVVREAAASGTETCQSIEVSSTPRAGRRSRNVAPEIISTSITSAVEGNAYLYDVNAIDAEGGVITYSLDAGPAGMAINTTTGVITWLPLNAQVGVHSVVVRATDPLGASATQLFEITVSNANRPPQFTSSPATTATIGLVYSYDADAIDLDIGDTLTYSLSQLPLGMTIDSVTGLINWTPTTAQIGNNTISVVVTDAEGLSASQIFTVSASEVNLPPSIVSAAVTNVVEGSLYTYDVNATDPNTGDILTYSLATAVTGVTIDAASGLINWLPTTAQVGSQTIQVQVTDQSGLSATQLFTVEVGYLNDAPVINSAANLNTTEGLLYQYDVEATDPDLSFGDVLTFSLDAAPAGVSIDASSGLIQWIASEAQVGSHIITTRVTDAQGLFATQTYNLIVANNPDAPTIISTWVIDATEDQLYSYDVDATDPDVGDVLTYSLPFAPTGMSINSSTGLIQWTPTNAQVGDHLVSVLVLDSSGLSANQSFIVAVSNINQAPVITSAANTSATESLLYQYAVAANDPDVGDVLSYSLTTAPSGMSIDAVSGVISWTPTEAQVGSQTVAVQVSDVAGLQDAQSYSVTVINTPNAPVFTSAPGTSATEGALYTYDANASDSDVGDTLTYSLGVVPAGMIIDAVTGNVQWTPVNAQVGTVNPVNIIVTDSDGLIATQTYNINVLDVNAAPSITSGANLNATEGTLYTYLVTASDPDVGDSLTFALDVFPAGMSINATTGNVQWTPSEIQVGSQSVIVRATDTGGLFATQSFNVVVSNQPNAPVFTTAPVTTVNEGAVYTYDADAIDTDVGDTQIFSLDVAPAAMTINASTGVVNWNPLEANIGVHAVTIRVTDSDTLFAVQSFNVTVADVPYAPIINSVEVTNATVAVVYNYDVDATDADTTDTITYSLSVSPAGMVIDSVSGEISWTPSVGQVGLNNVTVIASDGALSSTQSYSITVVDAPNTAPGITSTPTGPLTTQQLWTYQITFSDPDLADTHTFSLPTAPTGMTVSASGLVSWTPTDAQAGDHSVSVRVDDNRGGFGTQGFILPVELAVVISQPPQITSTEVDTAVVGQVYNYDVDATDPDGDVITYSLQIAPAGMSIDSATGLISWIPTAGQLGVNAVTVRASDITLYQEQSYNVTVSDVALPLDVIVQAIPNIINFGETTTVQAFSTGGTGAVTVSLTVNGVATPIDAVGDAVITGTAIGGYELIATATDDNETVSTTGFFSVRDPSDITPPTVSITSPATDSEISEPVDIIGTASDANLVNYRLLIAPAGTNSYTEIAVSTTSVVNGVLGRLDPTVLVNGLYDVVVIALDANGQQGSSLVTYQISGDLKVGNFSFTIDDMSLDMMGMPIEISRTYDTRQKAVKGDFGFGWQMEFLNVKVEENVRPGEYWSLDSSGGFFPQYCINPVGDHLVSVTLPGGETESFDIGVTPRCNTLVPFLDVQLEFTSRAGTTSALEESSPVTVRYNGGVLLDIFGAVDVYDPSRYKLTTDNGYVYELDQNFGVRSVRDSNGNQLTFNENGVFHSNGRSISIARNTDGLITSITDPSGNAINYNYNVLTDLTSVTDRENNAVKYQYSRSHAITEIIDSRGFIQARNIYDDDGRLVAFIDSSGDRIDISRDLGLRQEVVTDSSGNISIVAYDVSGNVLSRTDALGNVRSFTYDSEGNLLSETDPLGNVSTNTYDADGNQTSIVDPLGNVLFTKVFNSIGDLTSQQDGKLNITLMTYDSNNQITSTTDPLGNSKSLNYLSNGNLSSSTDENGNVTTYAYDSFGNKSGITDPLGNTTTQTYDANGRLLTSTQIRTVNGLPVNITESNVYDAEGRLTAITDAAGFTVSTEYDASGNVAAESDSNGNRVSYVRDSRGNPTSITNPDGSIVLSLYDENSNLLSQSDESGRQVQYSYDYLNRVTQVTNPDGTVQQREYDAIGRLTRSVDENGNETVTTYDAAGRPVRVADALGNFVITEFDATGLPISVTDQLGNVTQSVYDARNKITSIIYADGSSSAFEYDPAGRKSAETNQAGQRTEYEYDANGQLTLVRDILGNLTTYGYDEVGNRISQTDANGNTTTWTYDNVRNVTSRSLPGGQTETMTYDGNGNMLSVTDFNGSTTTFEYNSLNQLMRKVYPDASDVVYGYTANGLISVITDSLGTTSNTYNAKDMLERVDLPDGSFIAYTYDAIGNILTVEVPSGITSYVYDAIYRLVSVTDSNLEVTTYTYDSAGNNTSTTYANGTVASYTYDSLNRLTSLSNTRADSSVLSSYTYALDIMGNRLSVVESSGRTVNYTYDELNRLTQEMITDGATVTTIDYTYDIVGNRLSYTKDGAVTNYTYDVNDRMLTENTIIYTYDDNGNTLTKTDGVDITSYFYDYENRLVSTSKSLVTVFYVYDAFGNKVSQLVDGVVTNYLVDNNRKYAQVLEERNVTNNLLVNYTYGNDLISQRRGTTTSFYHYDGLGSTRLLTDTSNNITDTYQYDAYGVELSRTGMTENSYLYTGEQYDANSGSYYLRSRFYNPTVGRFGTMDTYQGNLSNPMSLHKYMYTNANPVNMIDPSGHFGIASFSVAQGVSNTLRSTAAGSAYRGYYIMIRRLISTILRRAAPRISKNLKELIGKKSLKKTLKAVMAAALSEGVGRACVFGNVPVCPTGQPVYMGGWTHPTSGRIIEQVNRHMNAAIMNGSPTLGAKMPGTGWGRRWLKSQPECTGNTRALGRDCDEYPWNASYTGGPLNYAAGFVSLRVLSASQNRSQGNAAGSFYRKCNIDAKDITKVFFNVVPITVLPRTYFIPRAGKNKGKSCR